MNIIIYTIYNTPYTSPSSHPPTRTTYHRIQRCHCYTVPTATSAAATGVIIHIRNSVPYIYLIYTLIYTYVCIYIHTLLHIYTHIQAIYTSNTGDTASAYTTYYSYDIYTLYTCIVLSILTSELYVYTLHTYTLYVYTYNIPLYTVI